MQSAIAGTDGPTDSLTTTMFVCAHLSWRVWGKANETSKMMTTDVPLTIFSQMRQSSSQARGHKSPARASITQNRCHDSWVGTQACRLSPAGTRIHVNLQRKLDRDLPRLYIQRNLENRIAPHQRLNESRLWFGLSRHGDERGVLMLFSRAKLTFPVDLSLCTSSKLSFCSSRIGEYNMCSLRTKYHKMRETTTKWVIGGQKRTNVIRPGLVSSMFANCAYKITLFEMYTPLTTEQKSPAVKTWTLNMGCMTKIYTQSQCLGFPRPYVIDALVAQPETRPT